MSVVLPQSPQLGFEFYRELLTSVRAHQDRVGDLIIEVNRDFARVKITQRGTRKQIEIAGPAQAGPFRDTLLKIEDEADELRYLLDSLRMKKSNLSGASSDIRLTVSVMESQVKLGEVRKPGDRPTAEHGKTQHRPPVGAGTVTNVEDLVETFAETTQAAPAAEADTPKAVEEPAAKDAVETLPEASALPASDPVLPASEKAEKRKKTPPTKVKAIAEAAAAKEPAKDAPKEPAPKAAKADKPPAMAAQPPPVEDITDIDSFLET